MLQKPEQLPDPFPASKCRSRVAHRNNKTTALSVAYVQLLAASVLFWLPAEAGRSGAAATANDPPEHLGGLREK